MVNRWHGGLRAMLAVATVLLATGLAHADMGPSCRCEVGGGRSLERAVLATAFGIFGVGALFVERRRRRMRARR